MEREAKEAAIIRLLDSYHNADRVSDAAFAAMLEGVAPYSVDAVAKACRRFRAAAVDGHNNAFAPNEAQLVAVVREEEERLARISRPLQGITEVNFGHGTVRTGHLTSAEVDLVFHHKGMLPDGRNMALLGADELKAEVASAKALPSPEPKRPADIVPHLNRMNVDA